MTMAGMAAGVSASKHLPDRMLRTHCAVLVIVVGLTVGAINVSRLKSIESGQRGLAMAAKKMAAQVVLNPSGLAAADEVMQRFAAESFQVGPMVGISFSIAAPVQRFEEFFGMQAGGEGFTVDQLPLDALRSDLRPHIDAVLFTRPPDFGPAGNY